MRLFLDTSAMSKRYVEERGSAKLLALCEQASELAVSVICWPELVSTLSRLLREKKLSAAHYTQLKTGAATDWADVSVCGLNAGVLDAATALLEAHPLRAMDALHIACAIVTAPDHFVSADKRQLAAARAAGLAVVDVSG